MGLRRIISISISVVVVVEGERVSESFVGAELTFEAEIGVFEEDTGVEEARAAHGEFVKGGPAAGRKGGGGRGEEVGDDGGDGGGALVAPANVADQRRELGGNTSNSSPVSWVIFELEEYVQNDIV